MTLKELEPQLLALNPIERAGALQILLSQSLGNESHCITKTSEVMGGDACIHNTRIPIWLLVSLRQQGATDAEILENYPQLTAADLVNAWAYATAYPEEIQTAQRQQDEAMQEDL
ncbi:MAG: DUF433 domain-containing protein [Acaryochloris sp. RU_4_1]|nr:DUF433 domain-containing protein [Acaryochloris sp. RU_4_1]